MASAERPRDQLGRPLPLDAPAELVGEPVPASKALADADAWELVMGLLSRGLPFHAHEVCEDRWRTSNDVERDTWRCLAQWCAARTHEARGNPIGAVSVARGARTSLHEVPTAEWFDYTYVDADLGRLIGDH